MKHIASFIFAVLVIFQFHATIDASVIKSDVELEELSVVIGKQVDRLNLILADLTNNSVPDDKVSEIIIDEINDVLNNLREPLSTALTELGVNLDSIEKIEAVIATGPTVDELLDVLDPTMAELDSLLAIELGYPKPSQ